MGWASGSRMAEDLWESIRPLIPKKNRKEVARKIIHAFEGEDCDTIDEAEDLCDAAGRQWNEETDELEYI